MVTKRTLLVFLFCTITLGLTWYLSPSLEGSNAPKLIQAQDYSQSVKDARTISRAFENAAQIITPSVVNISASKKVRLGGLMRGFHKGQKHPFHDFFGDEFLEKFFGGQAPERFSQSGMGTGFIIDKKGHIITNNHVVGKADEITVRLHDQRTFKAKIIGTDPKTDIAVIKIDAKNLKPAKLGDSDKLRIGEWVVAAGNPFGLDNTITTGIVSAKGRSINRGVQYEDFIQTDAAINPGNSGGPLTDLEGQVVGINSAIFSRSGGYMGIGFAIPINLARHVFANLIEHGKVIRGWLGVMIQDLNEDLAESFGYDGTNGVLVGDVTADGPAEKAGFRQGDIITEFDGRAVANVNQLRNSVAETSPGTKVKVTLTRDGREKTLKVKIGKLEGDKPAETVEKEQSQELGLELQALSSDTARRLNSRSSSGVVIVRVMPFSLAAKAGLQGGDIIITVQDKEVKSVSNFQKEIKSNNLKKGIRLIVENNGMRRFVILRSEN